MNYKRINKTDQIVLDQNKSILYLLPFIPLLFLAFIVYGFLNEFLNQYNDENFFIKLTNYVNNLFVLVVLIMFIYKFLLWSTSKFILFDNRILIKEGILRKRGFVSSYAEIVEVNTERKIVQKFFKTGNLVFKTGNVNFKIDNVKNYKEVINLLESQFQQS